MKNLTMIIHKIYDTVKVALKLVFSRRGFVSSIFPGIIVIIFVIAEYQAQGRDLLGCLKIYFTEIKYFPLSVLLFSITLLWQMIFRYGNTILYLDDAIGKIGNTLIRDGALAYINNFIIQLQETLAKCENTEGDDILWEYESWKIRSDLEKIVFRCQDELQEILLKSEIEVKEILEKLLSDIDALVIQEGAWDIDSLQEVKERIEETLFKTKDNVSSVVNGGKKEINTVLQVLHEYISGIIESKRFELSGIQEERRKRITKMCNSLLNWSLSEFYVTETRRPSSLSGTDDQFREDQTNILKRVYRRRRFLYWLGAKALIAQRLLILSFDDYEQEMTGYHTGPGDFERFPYREDLAHFIEWHQKPVDGKGKILYQLRILIYDHTRTNGVSTSVMEKLKNEFYNNNNAALDFAIYGDKFLFTQSKLDSRHRISFFDEKKMEASKRVLVSYREGFKRLWNLGPSETSSDICWPANSKNARHDMIGHVSRDIKSIEDADKLYEYLVESHNKYTRAENAAI